MFGNAGDLSRQVPNNRHKNAPVREPANVSSSCLVDRRSAALSVKRKRRRCCSFCRPLSWVKHPKRNLPCLFRPNGHPEEKGWPVEAWW